jgi:hypothetical protein
MLHRSFSAAFVLCACAEPAPSGEPGPPSAWHIPECGAVSGTDAVTFTTDEGATLAATSGVLSGTVYTNGVAALDVPNHLLAEHAGRLLRSEDAGCTWRDTGAVEAAGSRLTAAPGGRAYAWTHDGPTLQLIDADGSIGTLGTPTPNLLELAALPSDRVRIGGQDGTLYESVAGERFQALGVAAPTGGGVLGYDVAIDPNDPDHALFGASSVGAFVTFDAGVTWERCAGFSTGSANVFRLVVSPADGSVVYATALDMATGDSKHIYRSEDGGLTFEKVVDESAAITIRNGPVMAAHPMNADVVYFVFGTWYDAYGTDIYRYDHATGLVTTTHNGYDDVGVLEFSPATPSVVYLGLTSEEIQ